MNWNQLGIQAFLDREFRPMVWAGMFCCLMSVIFIVLRLQYKQSYEDQLKVRDDAARQLESTVQKAHQLIQSNAICQYYSVLDLNQQAIDVVMNRQHPDSIHALFVMLKYKGWKFESEAQFQRDHLPPNWAMDLNQLMEQKFAQSQQLEEIAKQLNAYCLEAEIKRNKRSHFMSVCLTLFMVGMYPLRWIRQYYHLLK
jgi:hypothetical protein